MVRHYFLNFNEKLGIDGQLPQGVPAQGVYQDELLWNLEAVQQIFPSFGY